MHIHKLAILVTMCSVLTGYGVRDIQKDEFDLDKEFQQLQKPSIKTIQNEYGDTYDCVDFYMQPAFDHPSLKNHTFHPQMTPSSAPTNEVQCKVDSYNMKLKDGGCPAGTIPIRRIGKNDFYHIKKFTEEYANSDAPGTHLAILQTNSDPQTTKYYGAGAGLSTYNLSIEPSQYSSAELIIQNGEDRIKVGWTVNPTLNKDNRVRTFGYFDAGQSHCFNTLCPGFVGIRSDIPIDATISGSTKRGDDHSGYMPMRIFQDVKTGHWWLEICSIAIGFWPKQIFTTMTTSASYVAVGGEVYGPPDHPLPPMGNGYYHVDDMSLSAYCINIVVLDENHTPVNPQHTETHSNDWHYGVYDEGITKNYGRVIYYGGTTLWI